MPQKGRLPPEEKTKIVEGYLSGTIGPTLVQEKYRVPKQTLYEWVRLNKLRGAEGLCSAVTNRTYAPEIKRQAVEEYLAGGRSKSELCTKYNISTKYMLHKWITRYNGHGDFKQPNNGGVIYMSKGRNTTLDERIEIVSYCIANNKDYGKTIEKYSVSYQQIYGWVRRYEQNGADGLIDRRGKCKDEASMTEIEKLRAQLKLKEAENLRLQMENELLKKLEALERGRSIN